MLHLFTLKQALTPSEQISALDVSAMRQLFGSIVADKGYSYFISGKVFRPQYSPGRIEACVQGSETYEVTFQWQSSQLSGICNCPHADGPCKHMAALLFHAHQLSTPEERAALDTPVAPASPAIQLPDYLHRLSKEEIIKLILDLAPPAFRKTIELQAADTGRQQLAVQMVHKTVVKRLSEIKADGFSKKAEDELLFQLMPLRVLWNTHHTAILKLIQVIIEKIEAAYDSGYLYDDEGKDLFNSEALSDYFADFILHLQPDRQKSTLLTLAAAIADSEYGIFDWFFFSLAKKAGVDHAPLLTELTLDPAMVERLTSDQLQVFYNVLLPYWTQAQQLRFLEIHKDAHPFFGKALYELYRKRADVDKAFELLEYIIGTVTPSNHVLPAPYAYFFEQRIELEQQYHGGKQLDKWLRLYLESIPSAASLKFALKIKPLHHTAFEQLVRASRPDELAVFLEETGRLDEALAILNSSHHLNQYLFNFLRRYKDRYANQALSLFESLLEKSLQEVNRNAYHRVAEIMLEIKPLLTERDFHRRVNSIKHQYAQRSAMMEVLQNAGL